MPRIAKDNTFQTVITTFEMTPGTAQDLMDALSSAYAEFISKQPGFIGAGLHINDAQTRIANYSQWERRNRKIHEMCKSFEPVMYDVVESYG